MTPAMTPAEIALLTRRLSASTNYLEFGSGGSTVLAATLVSHSITSVESDIAWADRVVARIKQGVCRPRLHMIHVDIGETGKFGYPVGLESRDKWDNYYTMVWQELDAAEIDLVLVDGRFRVACFLTTLLRCPPNTRVMIHDFAVRPEYQAVRAFADEAEVADNLSVFTRRRDFNEDDARACVLAHAIDPR